MEEWRPAPGVPGYEVSDLGRVRHAATREPASAVSEANGSVMVWMRTGMRAKPYRISRLVAEAFLPDDFLPYARSVRHVNGDSRDNRAGNLAWIYPEKGPSLEERLRAEREAWEREGGEVRDVRRVCGTCSRFTDLTGTGVGRCRDLRRTWNTESWATCDRWEISKGVLASRRTGNSTGTRDRSGGSGRAR